MEKISLSLTTASCSEILGPGGSDGHWRSKHRFLPEDQTDGPGKTSSAGMGRQVAVAGWKCKFTAPTGAGFSAPVGAVNLPARGDWKLTAVAGSLLHDGTLSSHDKIMH